jgi:dihydrofolate reductase
VRRVIVSALVTVDFGMEQPNSWAGPYFGADAAEQARQQLLRADAFLMGRGSYEYFVSMWADATGPYPDRINEMKKYVFSSTLTEVAWRNTELVATDARKAVGELKAEQGGDLVVYGYGRLARSLQAAGLVDELHFAVHPLLLGQPRGRLERIAVQARENGVVSLEYIPAGEES